MNVIVHIFDLLGQENLLNCTGHVNSSPDANSKLQVISFHDSTESLLWAVTFNARLNDMNWPLSFEWLLNCSPG